MSPGCRRSGIRSFIWNNLLGDPGYVFPLDRRDKFAAYQLACPDNDSRYTFRRCDGRGALFARRYLTRVNPLEVRRSKGLFFRPRGAVKQVSREISAVCTSPATEMQLSSGATPSGSSPHAGIPRGHSLVPLSFYLYCSACSSREATRVFSLVTRVLPRESNYPPLLAPEKKSRRAVYDRSPDYSHFWELSFNLRIHELRV